MTWDQRQGAGAFGFDCGEKYCIEKRFWKVEELWLKDRVAKGELVIRKAKGEKNKADILTRHVDKTT